VEFGECPITRDEFLDHRGDEFRRFDGFAGFARKDLGVGDKIAIQFRRDSDSELHWLFVFHGRKF